MKKCPACSKTFEDSMRFCQVDGTPLVDDVPAFDPYATIVAQPIPPVEPPAAAQPPAPVFEPAAPAYEPVAEVPVAESAVEVVEPEPIIHATIGSLPIHEPEDVLDLPSADPLKTMYVSDAEMKAALGDHGAAHDVIDIPPIEETPEPPVPGIIAAEVPSTSFGSMKPPPSPFSIPDNVSDQSVNVPSFNESEPEPEEQAFNEAATMIQPSFTMPEVLAPEPVPNPEPAPAWAPPPTPQVEWTPPAPIAEWTPPPVPDASWQNQEIGSNTPFQAPPAGATSPSSVMAIVSLVLGIIGLISVIPTFLIVFCGILPFLLGLGAAITGFLARSRAGSSPDQYGGRGMATIGIVLGVLDVLAPFGVVILTFLLWGGLAALGSLPK